MSETDLVKKIEARSKEDVLELLKMNGLGRVRRDKWKDYIQAKRICFQGMFINSEIYDKQINWIGEFLRV